MFLFFLLPLLLFPSFVLSQQSQSLSSPPPSQSQSQSQSNPPPSGSSANPSITVFTSLQLTTGFGPGRVTTVGTNTVVITSTLPPPTASGNSTSNATASGNATSSTTTSNLPTFSGDFTGGGINGAAPVPGASGANGAMGPDDGYIAAATALRLNTLLVGLGGVLVGGALVVF
ncbi:hypothetical protein AMATHDRAFT_44363 [Amanita thiersii Skay4041]|uniref:Uncharacterized protein n=1 Tax=Amanita thiersii Skay4041 TaxID=703135 RepID=A0A2A9P1K2_9AGAR|nr:hypothetical protein AMATHDRAFT_44363 [Amanita thiersii Skay4041]